MLLTIGELAEALGVCVGTLRRWDKAGILKAHSRTAGGHRCYLLAEALQVLGMPSENAAHVPPKLIVGYARVSSSDQIEDLARQKERLEAHLNGESATQVITDLGSGLNFKKRGLTKLIGLILSGQVARLLVTHKDRLLRVGFELIEQIVLAHGGVIEVLDDVAGNRDEELAKDVITIITVFSARLYGQTSHHHRQKAA